LVTPYGVVGCSGHLLFARRGELYVATFDTRTRQVTGDPVLIVANVLMVPFGYLAIKASGIMLRVPRNVRRATAHRPALRQSTPGGRDRRDAAGDLYDLRLRFDVQLLQLFFPREESASKKPAY